MAWLRFWLILTFCIQIEGICITTSPRELYCVNEFMFQRVYSDITILTLNGGFIAHPQLKQKFPNIQLVKVLGGSLLTDQCRALDGTWYEVQGCNQGKPNFLTFNVCFNM